MKHGMIESHLLEHMRVFGYLSYALVPQTQCKKLDDKAIKCIFVGYSTESKGYMLYHPQIKRILVSRDVVFVEDFVQPLLSCTRDSNVISQDICDSLLPLFSGGSSNVDSNEVNVQPMGVSKNVMNQLTDADVHDVLDEEMAENEQARGMPKWLVHTLCDSKLDAPLSSRTRSGSRHASYAQMSGSNSILSLKGLSPYLRC